MKRKKLAIALSMLMAFQASTYSFADSYSAYMKGYPNGSFKPSNTLIRAEVASIIASLIRNGEEVDSLEYKDVKKGHWAYESVNYLRVKGILSDDSKSIKEDMTRGELCSILVKAYNLTKDDDDIKKFIDIANHTYKEDIEIVASNGYMNGFPNGSFMPNNKLTRAEITVIINKVTGRENDLDDMKKMNNKLTVPTDVTIKHWAYADIISAINNLEDKDDDKNIINTNKNVASTDKKIIEKIDYKNLKDGEYEVSVELLKSAGDKKPSEKSMADDALEDDAILKIENGKAKLYISMEPMELKGFEGQKGHLENAWYYENKDSYVKYLSNTDKSLLKQVEIVKNYDDEGKSYPKIIAFPVKIAEEYAYIKVEVDIMKALGGTAPDAVVKIDWNSIELK